MNFADLLPWLAGSIGVPIVGWLKDQFGLSGIPAMLLAFVVSALIAVAGIFLAPDVGFDGDWLAIIGQVFAASQIVYNLLPR